MTETNTERMQVLENSIQKAIEMQEYYLITNGDLQDENKRLQDQLDNIKRLVDSDRVAHAVKFELKMMLREELE